MTSTQTARAARAYAAEHGVKYTAALRAVTGNIPTYPRVEVGQKIRFAGDRNSMTVRAVSEDGRFVVLTRPAFGDVTYTVIDFALGIRGSATSWALSFLTDEDCKEAVAAFVRHTEPRMPGSPLEVTSQISRRNRVWLSFTDRQTDPRTAAILDQLRSVPLDPREARP